MASITTIQSTDLISNSRTDINTNFSNLNTDKIETSVLDTDTTLASNSDAKVPTQKAVKTYIDTRGNVNASTSERGVVEEATQAEVDAGTAVGATGARLFVNPSTLPSVVPIVRVYSQSKTIPSSTTQFDITNPSGTTFRYTYDGTGTDPGITSATYPIGWTIEIQAENMSSGNNGSFTITGSGTNYFEITNAGGVAEVNKTIGGANSYIALAQTWTKPTGLKYVVVEMVGGGGSGTIASSGGAGGYSRKLISVSSLGATEPVLPGGGGATNAGGLQVNGFKSNFGTHATATGGLQTGAGGVGASGDINANGGAGGADATSQGGSSFWGGGGKDGVAGSNYGGGGGGAAVAGGNGLVVVTEYYQV